MAEQSRGILFRSFLSVLVVGLMAGCTVGAHHFGRGRDRESTTLTNGIRGERCCVLAQGTTAHQALVQAATGFLGRSSIRGDNRSSSADCAGFVRAVYATRQVDLYKELGELDGGNGVGRIYTYVLKHGQIHYGPIVQPGDLVFFHNTWDFNGDGLVNDPLTHVGVIETVEHDGTVTFVSWVFSGVERYKMNLRQPNVHKTENGRILNDYLRRRRSDDPLGTRYLSGQLFAAFGTVPLR